MFCKLSRTNVIRDRSTTLKGGLVQDDLGSSVSEGIENAYPGVTEMSLMNFCYFLMNTQMQAGDWPDTYLLDINMDG